MHFAFEIVLYAVGTGLAIGLLFASNRAELTVASIDRSRLHTQLGKACVLALVAWLPLLVFTHWLWHPLTGHYVASYPSWYWLVLLVGIGLGVATLVTRRRELFRATWWFGVLLVLLALLFTNPFGPVHAHWLHWPFAWLSWATLITLLVIALIGGIIWLVGKAFKVLVVVGAVLLFAGLIGSAIWGIQRTSNDHPSHKTKVVAAPTVTVTPPPPATDTAYHQRSASQCDAGFNVVWDKNKGNNLVSEGAPLNKYPTAAAAIKKLVTVMKHDSRVLYMYYITSPEQKLSPIKSEKELRGTGLNDGCYSAKGQATWNLMVAELAHAKVKNVTAPAYGVNTGAYHNGGAFQEAAGPITGNRAAVQITYENGAKVDALRRCLNVTTPGPIPGVPVKPRPTPTPHRVPMCFYLTHSPVPVPKNGLCPKLGSSEPSTVPTQAQKHHPSIDNPSEIARGPIQPVDSGNGLGTNAPRSTPAPAPTGHIGSGPTMSSQPTQPAVTATPVQASPTASSTVGPHGP